MYRRGEGFNDGWMNLVRGELTVGNGAFPYDYEITSQEAKKGFEKQCKKTRGRDEYWRSISGNLRYQKQAM